MKYHIYWIDEDQNGKRCSKGTDSCTEAINFARKKHGYAEDDKGNSIADFRLAYTVSWTEDGMVHRSCIDDYSEALQFAQDKAGYIEDRDGHTIDDFQWPEEDGESGFPYNVTDLSDEADALTSAGMGTEEDYGYYGGGEDW